MKLIKPLQCDCCHRVFEHYDAEESKCLSCGVTFSTVKSEKILSLLVKLGYLKKTVFRDNKETLIIYNLMKRIEQPKLIDYLERK